MYTHPIWETCHITTQAFRASKIADAQTDYSKQKAQQHNILAGASGDIFETRHTSEDKALQV